MRGLLQKITLAFLFICLGMFSVDRLEAQDRFPRPEFETEYQQPITTTPAPRPSSWIVVDIILLFTALVFSAYFALKKRSRRALFILMIFCLIYFGFIRHGCVCSIGAIQNVSLSLFNSVYILPVIVILFFVLPLLFTLFFGRTYCASVCPLGGIQDVVLLKPYRLPRWLSHVLGLIPPIYLGLAVLFAATGSAYIICRYDPFVPLFRLSWNSNQIFLSVSVIAISTIIARPYCRFLCPYGLILSWLSSLSKHHVQITPETCVECRLCEDACPVDGIHKPTGDTLPESKDRGVRRLAILIALIPVMIFLGGWTVSRLDATLSRVHPRVKLAGQIQQEDSSLTDTTTPASEAFRSSGTTVASLMEEVTIVQNRFRQGGWILGGFLGFIFGLKLIGLSTHKRRAVFEIDRSDCVSCGRCFQYCPVGRKSKEPS